MRGSEGAVAYPPERDRGSHEKRRTATTAPARPHAASTARWPGANPLPVTAGLKASAIAVAKWRNGKNHPSRSNHSGMRAATVNTSETKASVMSNPLVSACTAVAPRTTDATARPSAGEGRHADDERHHGGRQRLPDQSARRRT